MEWETLFNYNINKLWFATCTVYTGQARPGQARPGQARPGQARPGQGKGTGVDNKVLYSLAQGASGF